MVKKRETKVPELRDQTAASRRDFVKAGAAAGLGAAILSAPGNAQAQRAPADIRWDYEADVIVCGSGGTGIVAAKRAHDLGADVLVREGQDFIVTWDEPQDDLSEVIEAIWTLNAEPFDVIEEGFHRLELHTIHHVDDGASPQAA